MAGVGNIGSRIHLSKSPTMGRRSPARYKKSTSKQGLCDSIESLQSHHHEDTRLFRSTPKEPSLDVPGYNGFQMLLDYRDEYIGPLDFLCRAIDIFRSKVVFKLFLVLLAALPISMLAVGSSYKTSCPEEPRLLLYLLVGGGFGLLKVAFLFWTQRSLHGYESLDEKYDEDEDTEDVVLTRFVKFTNIALTLFLTIWFGFGNYWFYALKSPHFVENLHEPNGWCDRTLYLYYFYSLITCYALIGLSLVFVVLVLVIYYCKCCCRSSGDS